METLSYNVCAEFDVKILVVLFVILCIYNNYVYAKVIKIKTKTKWNKNIDIGDDDSEWRLDS